MLGNQIIELSVFITFDSSAHPLDKILMSFTLDINKIYTFSPEVSFLLWSDLLIGPVIMVNKVDSASVVAAELIEQQFSGLLLGVGHGTDVLVSMSGLVTTVQVEGGVEVLEVTLEERVFDVLVQSRNSATLNLVVILNELFGSSHSLLFLFFVGLVTNPDVDNIVKFQDVGLVGIQMLLFVKRAFSNLSALHLTSVVGNLVERIFGHLFLSTLGKIIRFGRVDLGRLATKSSPEVFLTFTTHINRVPEFGLSLSLVILDSNGDF
mmetsp:Transcript_65419/g.90411  ORF Transcript_65419/g.90411 Transcript_65419/m.90411 type:complete len:265 (+) Transcript_65419:1167-1961(+)